MLSKKTNLSRMSICTGSSQRATIGYMLITGVQVAIRWQAALLKLRNTHQCLGYEAAWRFEHLFGTTVRRPRALALRSQQAVYA